MITQAAASRHLHIDELVAVVDLEHQLGEQSLQLLALNGDIDLQQLCAVIEAVKVSLEVKYLVVVGVGGVINAVAEPTHPVEHWNGHILYQIVFAVIITEIFHDNHLIK